MTSVRVPLLLLVAAATLAASGCGGGALRATKAQFVLTETGPAAAPRKLTRSLFNKPADRQNLSEETIQRVLDAPLDPNFPARAGVVVLDAPFTRSAYSRLDPGDRAPQQLARQLERSQHFKLVSDISPHLAQGQNIETLRELATRYRLAYLVIFNRAFEDRSHYNHWGWAWLTLVGIPFVPAYTLQTEGIMEATLLDVRTGTFLFTVQAHIKAGGRTTPFSSASKLAGLQRKTASKAVAMMARRFLAKCNRLANDARARKAARAADPSAAEGKTVRPPATRPPAATKAAPVAAPATPGWKVL